ncbi:MAG TPA: TonB-dependent siderophore receptor [Sphingobium sp.]|nr:TonB-dependent siderophore receptor [Sphingobium sp.]
MKISLRAARLTAVLLASAASGQVWAHDQDEAGSDDIVVLGEANRTAASVATRLPVEIMETPFTITQLRGEVIEASAARSLSDALRYAGIVGGTDNFGNAGEFFSSRGFQLAAGSNYFRDGLRYRKYGQVPLYDIERIEFLRGPASILYGALEPGGVLNIVSRKPQDTFQARARVRGGSWNFWQGTADITGPIADGVNYRIQGLYENADSFRDIAHNESKGVTGALDIQATPTTLITARASWFRDKRTGDRGTVLAYQDGGRFEAADGRRYDFADIPRSRFLGEKFGESNFRDINLSLSLRQELGSNWQLRADLVRSDQKEDRVYIWANSTEQIVGANGLLSRQIGDWHARLKGTLGRLEIAGQFETAGLTHKIVVGAEYEHFRNDRTNATYQFPAINIYDPVYLESRPVNGPRNSNSPYGGLFKSRGVYIQDVVNIGEQFVLLGGLRYDHVSDDNTLNNSRRQIVEGWTPQVGLVWRPTPFISPYISYTRSFVPQTGTDRFGNPFDPEKGEQIEGGVKLDVRAARAIVTAAVFRLDRENLKVDDVGYEPFQRLSGIQRSKGFEMSLDANPVDPLRVTLNWNHLFSATYVTDNRYIGNTIPNAPEDALGLFVTYDLDRNVAGLSINGGVTYVGRRYGIANNSFYLPAYTLFDLGARYRLTPTFDLTANVRNLFDATYYTGAINSTSVNVGTPRSFMLGVGLGF